MVAPYAGAWIETSFKMPFVTTNTSLPTRERGLKHILAHVHIEA